MTSERWPDYSIRMGCMTPRAVTATKSYRLKTPCSSRCMPTEWHLGLPLLTQQVTQWSGRHLEHGHRCGRGKESETNQAPAFKGATWKWHTSSPPTFNWGRHASHMTHTIWRGQEGVILAVPERRTGNLEKKLRAPIWAVGLGWDRIMSDLVGVIRGLVLCGRVGNYWRETEQK